MPHAVTDALSELEVPGTGVAMLDSKGTILGARASAVPMLLDAQLRQIAAGGPPLTLDRWRRPARRRSTCAADRR